VQKAPKGLPEAFVMGESFIGKDNVALVLGDNIFEDDLSEIIKKFKKGGHIVAKKVPDPERFGVVKFDNKGKVLKIVEKPKEWISDYAIPGFYVFDNRVVEVAKKLKPSDRIETEIVDLFNYYFKKGELRVSVCEGEWLDAGTFDALLEASRIVKDKEIYKNFHPIINKAITEFNAELKDMAKKRLANSWGK
jgi:glucose-1-phosphate thymidylyltransferase